jgi:hypothetical protein
MFGTITTKSDESNGKKNTPRMLPVLSLPFKLRREELLVTVYRKQRPLL